MIQIAAHASVVVNVVGLIGVIVGALVGIGTVFAVGTGAGGVAVVMNFVVDDLVVIAPDGDAAVGASPDLEAIDDIVTAVQIDPLVAVREVLSINDRPASDLGPQHDGTGRGPAFAQVKPPAALIIGIDPGHDVDRDAGAGKAVGTGNRPERLRRGSGVRITTLRGHIEIGPLRANESQA